MAPHTEPPDPFAEAGVDLEPAIVNRAAACGITLSERTVRALAAHARHVLAENDRLHLTSITRPDEFLERHVGESLEGAAMLAPDVRGPVLDLGSGNGYPGIPVALARPGLRPLLLAESSTKKAAFLRQTAERLPHAVDVVARQVQRAADLAGHDRPRLIVTRAAGSWEKLLPRLARSLTNDGELLLWAGEATERVTRRAAWQRWVLEERRSLPGRNASWVWRFARA
jgi:16S rRNA (guanine527-N7)-methyltransferase